MERLWIVLLGGSLGAASGSFSALVVDRVRRGRSIVSPPSSCETCRVRIPPWRNVPIVTWLLQRGRCAACGTPISATSFVAEIAGAIVGAAITALATLP